MKLLLTSAGLRNKSITEALRELAGRPFAELNLVFIPTAQNVEKGDKGWLIDDLCNCKKLGFSSIDIVDISAMNKNIWLPRLEQADILLFGGGNVAHLIFWLEKSGLKELLPEMLNSKVYVGISAGSMVASKSISLSHTSMLYYEQTGKQTNEDGLGLVDFQIRPHFNSPDFPKANLQDIKNMAEEISDSIYALDDESAIKVVDQKVVVVSEGEWKKFN